MRDPIAPAHSSVSRAGISGDLFVNPGTAPSWLVPHRPQVGASDEARSRAREKHGSVGDLFRPVHAAHGITLERKAEHVRGFGLPSTHQ